jgi:hypothetical protein
MADDDAAGATPRLAAVALAPSLTAATILRRLRVRIDAAFLPRPLRVVDTLPRNQLGKLPRAEILRLIRRTPSEPVRSEPSPFEPTLAEPAASEPIQADLVAASPAPILLRFAADHPAGPGHFPGNPIVPGGLLLDELVATIFPGGWSGVVESAKFHHPVRPGDTVAVTCRVDGDSTRFECRLAGNGQLVMSGVLRTLFPSR